MKSECFDIRAPSLFFSLPPLFFFTQMKQPVNKKIATVKKRDGYIYIDPPELSDGIYTPESKNMVERLNAAVYTDMNVPSARRWLKILGRALYNRREGKEEGWKQSFFLQSC